MSGRRGVPSLDEGALRCLSMTCASSGGLPTSPNNLDPGLVPGRVAAAHRGAFDVWTADEAVRCGLPGRFLHDGTDIAVGDWVGVADAMIQAVLPRRSAIVRNAAGMTTTAQTLAANVDIAFVVSSLGPDLEPRRLERYLVSIWETGAIARDRSHEGRPARGSVGARRRGRGGRARRARPRRLVDHRPGLRRATRASRARARPRYSSAPRASASRRSSTAGSAKK